MNYMIKIGYQGIEYSNNYFAAEMFVEERQIKEFDLIPLVSSANVVEKLMNNETDLGIMAVSNSTIGRINETENAMAGKNLREIAKIEFVIKHAAFKLDENLNETEVKYVVSHEAALEQCRNTLKQKYPNAEFKAIANTALGPGMLINGDLSPFSVILCAKKAGEKYNLFMDDDNLADKTDNVTTFGVFKFDLKRLNESE